MIRRLLAVYEDQTFTENDTAQKRQKIGCKSIQFGGKAHVLDSAEILNQNWSLDDKYAKTNSINNCWKNCILKGSYFDISTSETDAEIVGDASVEEENALKLYMNDLVE